MLKEHSSMLGAALRGVDWIIVAGAGWGAHWVYMDTLSMRAPYELALVLGVLLTALIFPQLGLYRAWRGASLLDEIKQLTIALSTVAILMLAIVYFSKAGAVYSRVWALSWVVAAWIGLLSSRILLRGLLNWARKKGYNHRRIVIVGGRDLGREVASRITAAPWTGLEILGFFCDDEVQSLDLGGAQFSTIGRVSDVAACVANNDVDQVWLAMPLKEEDRVREVLHDLRHATVDIRYVPDLFGLRLINHSITEVAGLPVLNLSVSPMEGVSRVVKAAEDRVLSFLILLITSPLFVAIAIGVKMTSEGPILFKQKRHGWDGREIRVYKFRTMVVHQEADGVVTQARRDDPRVTRFGAYLRRTSLDELPQFFNVLQGRMSIVGPRPHALAHNELYKDQVEHYMLRHRVKPGITGWAQVNGYRGETDSVEKMRKRVEYDLYYIENWSLWFDLKIILLTIFRGFFGKNAY
jgi:Undecaprenyl-phosphate glucose phosphotransferase